MSLKQLRNKKTLCHQNLKTKNFPFQGRFKFLNHSLLGYQTNKLCKALLRINQKLMTQFQNLFLTCKSCS